MATGTVTYNTIDGINYIEDYATYSGGTGYTSISVAIAIDYTDKLNSIITQLSAINTKLDTLNGKIDTLNTEVNTTNSILGDVRDMYTNDGVHIRMFTGWPGGRSALEASTWANTLTGANLQSIMTSNAYSYMTGI